uniref:Uncharacterized protein n=1 Tax=Arundo donax TaxID=35708 RepID=A0A0A9AES5_ARUDO
MHQIVRTAIDLVPLGAPGGASKEYQVLIEQSPCHCEGRKLWQPVQDATALQTCCATGQSTNK